MIRPCVVVPCFYRGVPLPEVLHRVAALGFDAVELYGWRDLDFKAVRQAVSETGVEILSMCTTEFRMTDPAFRAAWLDGLRESCAAAQSLGVGRLITQVGADTGAPRELQHAAIVETLRAAVPILEAHGVTVMIEPLNHKNHPGYYLTYAREAFDIVREVDCPYARVVYDIYHQQVTEGNILPSILENLDCIAHLHGAGHPGRIELQYGENDYGVILRQVEAAGYRGAFGLEYRPTMDAEASLKRFREIYSAKS